jgi:hypothetical protein
LKDRNLWQLAWFELFCILSLIAIHLSSFPLTLGEYQLLNILTSTGIKKNDTSPVLVLGISGTIIGTSMVLVLRSKVEFWLVCGKYILDTEINLALVLNWYYLKSLPRRNWYKADICLRSYTFGQSLMLRPIPIYIPGFQSEDVKSTNGCNWRQYKNIAYLFFPWLPICPSAMCFVKHILGMPNTFWVLLSTLWVCNGHITSITSPKSA